MIITVCLWHVGPTDETTQPVLLSSSDLVFAVILFQCVMLVANRLTSGAAAANASHCFLFYNTNLLERGVRATGADVMT